MNNYPKKLHASYLLQINQVWEYAYIRLTILPDLRLKIELTEDGEDYMADYVGNLPISNLESDLLEGALCNGWTDDWQDGRLTLSQCGIADDGEILYRPGDLCWFDNQYAIRSFTDVLRDDGEVVFSVYYMGDDSLDEQKVWKL